MAPNVQVPTNFGRHHIGSLTHSNLTLNLKDGRKSRANSLILSFNSPVIESLVASLDLTSLDMDDFQETAVDCFIDCLYTGEIEKMDKPVFREVHKMSRVFNVCWLVARCAGYFTEMVENMKEESYEDMLFLFEEADFVFSSLKEREFIDLAMEKIGAIKSSKTLFIEKFMEEFSKLSTHQLDLIVELAGCDLHIVVNSLTGHLVKHVSTHGAILSESTRHVLNNCDLSICRRNDEMVYRNLFDALEGIANISYNDLKWVLKLHRTSTESARVDTPAQLSTKIPNLFHSFDRFKDLSFDALVDALAIDPEVRNFLMFAEALWTWMMQNKSNTVACSPELILKIQAIKQKRGWTITTQRELELFDFFAISSLSNISRFFAKFRKWQTLSEDRHPRQVIKCQQLVGGGSFCSENKLVYYFNHPETVNCKKPGRCGFILKTTPATEDNPDLFDIRLCTDHNEYSDEIHLHEDVVRAENMHFMVYILNGYDCYFPVSWLGKLNTDKKWGWLNHCHLPSLKGPSSGYIIHVLYDVNSN